MDLLRSQETTSVLRKNIDDCQELLTQLLQNIRDTIRKIPRNSPLRIPLIAALGQKIRQQTVQENFNITHQQYNRSQSKISDILLMKSAPGATREKIDPADVKLAKDILNKLAPVQSGRNWRLKHVKQRSIL